MNLYEYGPVLHPANSNTSIAIKVESRKMLETTKYRRKPFSIEAVQITDRNMADVAGWTGGTIKTDDQKKMYIEISVKNAQNPRQKQGYVSDWVLASDHGFKVYTNKAFKSSFEQVSTETSMHDVVPRPYVPEPEPAPVPAGTGE